MQFECQTCGNTLLVKVGGELDLSVADNFRDQVEDVLSVPGIQNLILDLDNVYFIDSSGLGVILGRYKKVSQKGGRMALVSPKPQVRRILELSGILRLMATYDDCQEALERL